MATDTPSDAADAPEWRRAARAFAVDGEWLDAEPISTGHINASWLARCRTTTGIRRFVLQSINTRVFTRPDVLMDNLVRVTEHLARAVERRGVGDAERRCLRVVRARDGATTVRLDGPDPWRAFPYIERSRHHDVASSPAVAAEAGRVFGRFAADLADWSGPPLGETIPRFHDFPLRVSALEAAVAADARERSAAVEPEVEAALAGAEALRAALATAGADEWPVRVVHNDCKLNNALFDVETGEGLCAVDLDTVMPGRIAYDVGELVRSATCAAPEDERDLSRVGFDLDLFAVAVRGYLDGAEGLLTPAERAGLPLAGPLMTLENGVRFLTDHLEGDVYFPAHRPGHNLDRARVQLQLFQSMWAARDRAVRAVEGATD